MAVFLRAITRNRPRSNLNSVSNMVRSTLVSAQGMCPWSSAFPGGITLCLPNTDQRMRNCLKLKSQKDLETARTSR